MIVNMKTFGTQIDMNMQLCEDCTDRKVFCFLIYILSRHKKVIVGGRDKSKVWREEVSFELSFESVYWMRESEFGVVCGLSLVRVWFELVYCMAGQVFLSNLEMLYEMCRIILTRSDF